MPFVADHVARTTLKLSGYRTGFVPTSVGDMHYVEGLGTGPLDPVVLLHGFSAAGVHFFPLLSRLRPKVRRLLAPDMPAHGFSETPKGGMNSTTMRLGLYEALEALIKEPSVVFGNSMGGFAAVRYALERPENVKALVLCSPGGAAMDQAQLDEFRKTFHIQNHRDALEFIDKLFGRPSMMRQVWAWGVKRKLTQLDMRELIGSVSIEDLLTPEDLAKLEVPILLIWGAKDDILPHSHRDFFRAHLPKHAHVAEPEHFGHSPYLEDPETLSREIVKFLETL